jgi:hypothetical protein
MQPLLSALCVFLRALCVKPWPTVISAPALSLRQPQRFDMLPWYRFQILRHIAI